LLQFPALGGVDQQMPQIRFFEELGLSDRPSVGGKGANLGELMRAGIPVPAGFVVTTDCFRDFMATLDPEGAMPSDLEGLDAQDTSGIAAAGAAMRARIEDAPLPGAIDRSIRDAHVSLCSATELPVAVRSSATGEDAEDASFAGLQDTYLWLRGADVVARQVRACWASLYSTESLAYRRKLGLREDGIAMAVVVQRMVDARTSGVMFTRSPLTGDRSVIVIEGSYGLGSCIVSGEVTPDKFVINKITGDISDRTISCKAAQHVPDRESGGVREAAVGEALQNAPCITDDELRGLAAIAKKVERHYGRPQDIEWAIDQEGSIFLLQSRPETVWSKRDAAPVAQARANAIEHVFAALGGRR
jgi:pyruvate,water dikinase